MAARKVMTGFSHSAVLSVANTVIEAVKSGAIKHFFLVGGCDGARLGCNYYTEFVKQTPADSVVMTLACGKYRFNGLDLARSKDFLASWIWVSAMMRTAPLR